MSRTQKVIAVIGQCLFWLVFIYGAYALWVSTGYNLAAEAAYREVAGWTEGAEVSVKRK